MNILFSSPFKISFLFASFFSPGYYTAMSDERTAIVESIYYISLYTFADAFHYKGVNPKSLEESEMDHPVVICLHGNKSHPATLIPFIDTLRSSDTTKDLPIFVPALEYDDEEQHRAQEGDSIDYSKSKEYEVLRQTIASLKKQFDEKKKQLSIIFVGHSRGSITSCYYTFCLRDKIPNVEILAIFAIAGRLKYVEPCPWFLRQQLIEFQNKRDRNFPLYTIFGAYDWAVPRKSLAVAFKDKTFIAPYKSHLSILFDQNALEYIRNVIADIDLLHRL